MDGVQFVGREEKEESGRVIWKCEKDQGRQEAAKIRRGHVQMGPGWWPLCIP
jgi:hypothetical protein